MRATSSFLLTKCAEYITTACDATLAYLSCFNYSSFIFSEWKNHVVKSNIARLAVRTLNEVIIIALHSHHIPSFQINAFNWLVFLNLNRLLLIRVFLTWICSLPVESEELVLVRADVIVLSH